MEDVLNLNISAAKLGEMGGGSRRGRRPGRRGHINAGIACKDAVVEPVFGDADGQEILELVIYTDEQRETLSKVRRDGRCCDFFCQYTQYTFSLAAFIL